jgi:uncharacterized protein (TIGR02646 family)
LKPVEYSGTNAAIVNAFDGRAPADQSGAYWSEEEIKPVKSAIKTHYIAEQKGRCCYCNHEFATVHHAVWDCEHIIPKKTHPQWLFEPQNLAAACKDCNQAKGDSPVLKNKSRVTFPTNSSDYTIVHPHFDEYYEHIRWIGTIVRPNGSEKGKHTIEICNLLRFAVSEAGMQSSPADRRFDQLVGDLLARPGPDDARMILAALGAYLEARATKIAATVEVAEPLEENAGGTSGA